MPASPGPQGHASFSITLRCLQPPQNCPVSPHLFKTPTSRRTTASTTRSSTPANRSRGGIAVPELWFVVCANQPAAVPPHRAPRCPYPPPAPVSLPPAPAPSPGRGQVSLSLTSKVTCHSERSRQRAPPPSAFYLPATPAAGEVREAAVRLPTAAILAICHTAREAQARNEQPARGTHRTGPRAARPGRTVTPQPAAARPPRRATARGGSGQADRPATAPPSPGGDPTLRAPEPRG